MEKNTKKKGKLKWIIAAVVVILVFLIMAGSEEDTTPTEKQDKTQQTNIDTENLIQDSVENSPQSEYQQNGLTPKEQIFSGNENNYPIYVFIKGTELITVQRYIFMGNITDMVDITFKTAVGDDSGKMELEVRHPSFEENETFLKIHDWEYDNLDNPIIVTFADDMSYIDVLATWRDNITNEQSLYDGHYELEGIYTLDEYVSKFYTADGFTIPVSEEWNEDVVPYGMIVGDKQIKYLALSGKYIGTKNESEIDVNMYSSPEETIVGKIEISFESGEGGYSGEIAETMKNVYMLVNITDEVVLGASKKEDGMVCLQLYVNGEFIDEYWMQEHYES